MDHGRYNASCCHSLDLRVSVLDMYPKYRLIIDILMVDNVIYAERLSEYQVL